VAKRSVPTINAKLLSMLEVVGTAQERLCPPYDSRVYRVRPGFSEWDSEDALITAASGG
jgi:hypothetical protein